MSYLRNFKGVPNQTEPGAVSVVASSISDPDLEAKFTHLRLNGISAQAVINSISGHVQALNLSHNRIELLPKSLPTKVIGLNLSFNILTNLRGAKALANLIELNVSDNNIVSLVDLSLCIGLQYLNISNNHLEEIVGLESLANLKMLNCSGNLIQSNSGFRTLSFNTQLLSLDVARNPVAEFSYQDVRLYIQNILPNLKTLDSRPIRSNQIGYTEIVQPVMKKGSPNAHNPATSMQEQHSSYFYVGTNQLPVSAMSSPTWSSAGQQQPFIGSSRNPNLFASTQNHSSSYENKRSQAHEIQNIEPNAQSTENKDNIVEQEEIDEAYRELYENRFVANSKLPWRNPPNPLPREFASRPWLTDSITANKKEDYDRTKSPINYYLQLRQRSDAEDVSSVNSVVASNFISGNRSVLADKGRHHLENPSEKSLHQYYDLNTSKLSVCHPDIPVQHHPRPRDPSQLPLLPTEISTLQVDGRTSFVDPPNAAEDPHESNINGSVTSGGVAHGHHNAGGNSTTLLAKTQQSFSYSNHKAPAPLRSYTKAYQKTMQTFEKNRSKNPQLLPHQQPYDGVYPSPVMTPLHHQYPGFHTLRGNEDDEDLYAGVEDTMGSHPQGQLYFGPDVSPLSGPHGHHHSHPNPSSSTGAWMAPFLRSPAAATSTSGALSPNNTAATVNVNGNQEPVWDILEVARRWDIHPKGGGSTDATLPWSHDHGYASQMRSGRGGSRSPHPTLFTPDTLFQSSQQQQQQQHAYHPRSRSVSPTKSSVLRAEFIKSQKIEQEQLKILEEHPPRKPRFADTYVPPVVSTEESTESKLAKSQKEDQNNHTEKRKSRSISSSRIRRSNLKDVIEDGTGNDESTTGRGRSPGRSGSQQRSNRPPSRSKSPYQNLLDLKTRIRNLLDHEAEYFEAKQQELRNQQQQQQPPLSNHRGVKGKLPDSRVFDFLRGEMLSSESKTAEHSDNTHNQGTNDEDPLNTSFQTQRSTKSNASTGSLVMMPTIASRNMLKHPGNLVKSSAVLTPATKASLANTQHHYPPSKATRQQGPPTSSRPKTPMKPPGTAPVSTKRAVSPAAVPRNKSQSALPNTKLLSSTVKPSRTKSSSPKKVQQPTTATDEVAEEMTFLKTMNEYLELFENAAAQQTRDAATGLPSASSSSSSSSSWNMEQMMGAGFALYEQLVRKRAQLMEDMRHTSPANKYSTLSPQSTLAVTSPVAHRRSSRLARESEHVLRALQKYMMDMLAWEEHHGGGHLTTADPQLLQKLRSLTPNKYALRNHHWTEEGHPSTKSHASMVDNAKTKELLAEEMRSIATVIDNLKARRTQSPATSPSHRMGSAGASSPPPPPPPPPPLTLDPTAIDSNYGTQQSHSAGSSLPAAVSSPAAAISPRPSKIPVPLHRTNSNRTMSTATTTVSYSTNNSPHLPVHRTSETFSFNFVPVDEKPNRPSLPSKNAEDDDDIVVDEQGKILDPTSISHAPASATSLPRGDSQRDMRYLASTLAPSGPPSVRTTPGPSTSSFFSPITAPADDSHNQSRNPSYGSFDQSTVMSTGPAVATLPLPMAPPTTTSSENSATMSMQAMAIGSLIAQLTARQKESLQNLQQQLQQPPGLQPSHNGFGTMIDGISQK